MLIYKKHIRLASDIYLQRRNCLPVKGKRKTNLALCSLQSESFGNLKLFWTIWHEHLSTIDVYTNVSSAMTGTLRRILRYIARFIYNIAIYKTIYHIYRLYIFNISFSLIPSFEKTRNHIDTEFVEAVMQFYLI